MGSSPSMADINKSNQYWYDLMIIEPLAIHAFAKSNWMYGLASLTQHLIGLITPRLKST